MKRNCPLSQVTGKPDCHIIDHPTWSDQRFCVTCRANFRDENHVPLIPIVLVTIVFGLVLTGVEENTQPTDPTDPVPAQVTIGAIK